MTVNPSPQAPPLDALRTIVAAHGVDADDAALEAARSFLASILPALERLQRELPPDALPAGLPESAG
jgi:hypothetical protein